MALGCLLLTAAVGLSAYNIWDGRRAGQESARVLGELMTRIETIPARVAQAEEAEIPAVEAPQAADPMYMMQFREMATEVIDGYSYIGVLEIPSLGISLPVMENWDYDRLRVAPCRYQGSVYTDNLVIAGHNYAQHFSPIKWIKEDTDVYFATADGEIFHYVVDSVETLRPAQVEDLVDAWDWDLTMFTCTTGGNARCAVRCRRVSVNW
jgi:sortase A